jgi:iron donor protein CyaY
MMSEIQNERDYMTESPGNEPSSALFARIQQGINARDTDIRQNLSGNSLRLEFADGQRILINFDAATQKVWLAARTGGIEFSLRDGSWRSPEQSELFAKLSETIDQTIASNPLNARARVVSQPEPTPASAIPIEARPNHILRNLLIVLLAILIGVWASQRPNHTPPTKSPDIVQQTLSLNKLHYPCEGGFPSNGKLTIFAENGFSVDGTNDPEITLKNDHTHPVLMLLSPPQTAIPTLSVLVHAKQITTLHLPAGQYDMMFSVGNTWCNPRNGFSEGHLLKFDKPLTVQAEKPVQLTLQTSGVGMEDFQLFVKTAHPESALPPPTFTGDGSIEVQRQADGHFYLPGTIDQVALTFMVDTGASVTSISSELARQIGIRNCKEMQFQTANGSANGCIALVPNMTLGNFELHNITIAVMPNLDTNLLGANVLRNFQVNQSDSNMIIGKR